MTDPIAFVSLFYNLRGGAENLIKEANNDAGLTAHPSGRFDVNGNHFPVRLLAYNLNCWLILFNRAPQADPAELQHTTLAASREGHRAAKTQRTYSSSNRISRPAPPLGTLFVCITQVATLP